MSDVKSDIQIAREAKMQPINDILAKINVPDESAAFSPMGRHIAKINLEYLDTLKDKPDGKLILVTAITPTPAGEGKTTTSVGLNDGLNKIMTTSIENIYLRSPDMQMLLNLLAEKEGMWSAILILSIFDVDFKNEFKVIHFEVY